MMKAPKLVSEVMVMEVPPSVIARPTRVGRSGLSLSKAVLSNALVKINRSSTPIPATEW